MGLPTESPRGSAPSHPVSDKVSRVDVDPLVDLEKEAQMLEKAKSSLEEESSQRETTRMDVNEFSSSVYASLKLGLDFSHGRNFSKDTAASASNNGTTDRDPADPVPSQVDNQQPLVHDEEFEQMIDDMDFKKVKAQKWVPKAPGPLLKGESSGVTTAVSASPDKINSFVPPVAVVLPSPSTTPNLDSSSSMAVFEVDPTPWLPWGHQVIDGGPTRLPRTFYYAAQDPLQHHHDYCIAVVEPAPPPADEVFWREQVLNFLIGPLNRNVLDNQPSLFGAGLFQLSSPNAVNALVQHGHYQLLNRFVRFIRADDAPQNHRAALGYRKGWLMFLGTPPDYRNDFDISSAVSTFGKFHYWNRDDPIKERILVYASFNSPALVPRDVVFGKFSSVGGVKETWTAPVFILSAEFAEQLPADEDPMPPDGNPHPMLGHLQPNMNIFVVPQFPEIGWDVVQEQPAAPVEEPMQDNMNVMDDLGMENQQSMVLNLSDSSSDSVNMVGAA
ncbi:hypothetical protein ACQ4PT_030635 [Festuca glaucescens]